MGLPILIPIDMPPGGRRLLRKADRHTLSALGVDALGVFGYAYAVWLTIVPPTQADRMRYTALAIGLSVIILSLIILKYTFAPRVEMARTSAIADAIIERLEEREKQTASDVNVAVQVAANRTRVIIETIRFTDRIWSLLNRCGTRAQFRLWSELGAVRQPRTKRERNLDAAIMRESEADALRFFDSVLKSEAQSLAEQLKALGADVVRAEKLLAYGKPANRGEIEDLSHLFEQMATEVSECQA
jgi:hypothetical protein